MKTHLFLLFSAGALILGLAGCASPAGAGLASDRTLALTPSLDPGLPFPIDDGTAAILTQMSVTAPRSA